MAAIPASAGDQEGKVTVMFNLRRDGVIAGGVPLTHSSGDSVIDSAARVAIEDSAPFRNLPPDLPEPTVAIRVTYAYDHPHAAAVPTEAPQ